VRECRSAARLRHPNIVAVFESGRADGENYIASEFVAGQPLSARIASTPPELEQAVAWVADLAEALAYAHGEGVVQRDIKPDNIMIGAGNRPQLMDFGLAKRVDEDNTLTTDGNPLGTPAYMSPEQARGELKQVGPQSDQYSLGVVLFESNDLAPSSGSDDRATFRRAFRRHLGRKVMTKPQTGKNAVYGKPARVAHP
jgi:eukaryotic-like serine/threonine-protein kinase